MRTYVSHYSAIKHVVKHVNFHARMHSYTDKSKKITPLLLILQAAKCIKIVA